jgi:transcriptional regulator with XRE-family HTH domain
MVPVARLTAELQVRVGQELRRLREVAGLSGKQVAAALGEGWSQSKVSRIEGAQHGFTVQDVTKLLVYYGVGDDIRAELLAATAEANNEGAWLVRAGGYPRRQGTMATLESVTRHIRQYQPVMVPGLLQSPDYIVATGKAVGVADLDAFLVRRQDRQKALQSKSGPTYEVVLDARALLLGIGPACVLIGQVQYLTDTLPTLDKVTVRVIPLATEIVALSTVAFTMYDFKDRSSPSVVWVEAPAGDAYFSAREDVALHAELFKRLQGVALDESESVRYLRSFVSDIERYTSQRS